MAYRFAMASDFIKTEVIEVSEFPQIEVKYDVSGVPLTVINETERLLGAQPESEVLKAMLHAIGK